MLACISGRRGDGGFNGCCSGASIGDGGFMLACISGRRGDGGFNGRCLGASIGDGGFNVATSQLPVREKVRPALSDGGASAKKFALRTKNGP